MIPLIIYILSNALTLSLELKPKNSRWRGVQISTVLFILLVGGIVTFKQERATQREKAQDAMASEAREKLAEKRNAGLLTALAASDNVLPSAKLAVIGGQMSEVQAQRDAVIAEKQLTTNNYFSVGAMRKSYSQDESLKKLESEAKRLRDASNSIVELNKARQAKQQEEEAAKTARQEKAKDEQYWNQQAIDTFDVAIGTLNSMLLRLSGETGLPLSSDFKNKSVAMRSSAMVDADMVIPEANHISLGTNAAWSFVIQTFDSPPMASKVGGFHFPFSMRITTSEPGSNAVVTITPFKPWQMMSRSDRPAHGATVRVFSPYGIGVDHSERVGTPELRAYFEKWMPELLKVQDHQFPLVPTNAPAN